MATVRHDSRLLHSLQYPPLLEEDESGALKVPVSRRFRQQLVHKKENRDRDRRLHLKNYISPELIVYIFNRALRRVSCGARAE